MFRKRVSVGALFGLGVAFALAFVLACGAETVVVEKEVIKEVQVPGETVVVEKEVIKTVEVPGQTVTTEVIKEVQVPGETITVTKEVIKEVQVPGETVVVTKEVIKEVQVAGETVVVTQEVIKEVQVPGETVVVEKIVIATPRPVPASSVKITPAGTFKGAISGFSPVVGWAPDCSACSQLVGASTHEGLFTTVRTPGGTLALTPWLVESWDTAPDLAFSDFKMREGVQFHQGWGEMTAEDVAWYFNLLNTVTNPESKHDTGVQIFDLASAEALDRYTVRFNWLGFGGYTLMQEFTDLQEGVEVSSKKAFDTKGDEWLLENLPIGTGPYEIQKWIQNEEIRLVAVADHWNKVPYISRVSILAVPEGSTRRAMLESHQVHGASVTLKDMPAMIDLGFRMAPEVIQQTHQLSFAGNYWENTHAQTGEALERERDISVPWIGDPFELGATYDENTPSMQSSKKVRTALAMDIDRELIAETILGGIGYPISVTHMATDDALLAKYEGRWDIPYDPAAAKQLLSDAGFGEGFTAQIWTGPSGTGVEIWDAIGSIWLNDLNVTPEFDRTNYYSVHRPAIVSRTSKIIHSACCPGAGVWPMEWSETSYNFPAGYNVGFEFPQTSQLYLDKRKTADPVAVEQLGVDQYDFYHKWMVNVGVARWPDGAMYHPQFMEWDEGRMRPLMWGKLGGLRSFEWIQLK